MSLLKRIKISNFRSIKKLELNFYHNYIVFTGENNSGKSNILKALSLLYNRSNHELIDDEAFLIYNSKDDDITIEIEFQDSPSLDSITSYALGKNMEPKIQQLNRCVYLYISPIMLSSEKIDIDYDKKDPYTLGLHGKLMTIIGKNNALEKTIFDKETFDMFSYTFNKNEEQYRYQRAMSLAAKKYSQIPMKSHGVGIQKRDLLKQLLDNIILNTVESLKLYKNEDINIVIAIDEPENSLHPSLQKEIALLLQNPTYTFITFLIASHSYNFLNYLFPESNYLVSKVNEETIVKECNINEDKNFQEICSALGMPIESDVLEKLYGTKEKIFIVEGKTDKQHILNCLKLYPRELEKLNEYTIIFGGGADDANKIAIGCKKIHKKYIGFLDNDEEGLAKVKGTDLKTIPTMEIYYKNVAPNEFCNETAIPALFTGAIEPFTGALDEFYQLDSEINNLKNCRKEAVDNEDEKLIKSLGERIKALKKAKWKEHLTQLTENESPQAKHFYVKLKNFLRYIME